MILEFLVLASSYCDRYISNGSRMDCKAHTAASRSLPIGTCISIKGVAIKINDIGPCSSHKCRTTTPHIYKRQLDLSHGAAKAIGFDGLGMVKYRIVDCK